MDDFPNKFHNTLEWNIKVALRYGYESLKLHCNFGLSPFNVYGNPLKVHSDLRDNPIKAAFMCILFFFSCKRSTGKEKRKNAEIKRVTKAPVPLRSQKQLPATEG